MASLPIFDPRFVPVIGVDRHLPRVDADAWERVALQRRFAAGTIWTPEFRVEPKFTERTPVQAAVLIPLVMRDEVTVLLTQRTAHLSSHSGQIAFPGGKVDASDESVVAAALREAHEEVGLDARHIEVMGSMPTYTTGSAYIVTPVVALVHPGFSLTPNPGEVDDVFEVPLRFLMDPANHRRHQVEWQGSQREWLSMPYTDAAGERFIWGATAGMLRNLYCFLGS